MKRSIKSVLTASMAALCVMGMGMSVNAYELNPEVKDVTPALREASTVGVWTHENPAMKNAPNKDAILVMTFGTTFTDTRHKTIDAVEKAIQEANPNVPVYEAYTSHIIIDRVKAKEGITKMTPEEAFAKLKADGYTRVAVVSLDVIPGMEYSYDSVVTKMQAPNFKKISLATPLMYFQGTEGEPDQVVDFLKAVSTQFPKMGAHDATLIMAPGTPKLKAGGCNHVTLMPIMMVAGDHANNDMAGSDPDSHKSQLEAQGFKVSTYIHGLGENKAVRDIYVQRADEALAALQK